MATGYLIRLCQYLFDYINALEFALNPQAYNVLTYHLQKLIGHIPIYIYFMNLSKSYQLSFNRSSTEET